MKYLADSNILIYAALSGYESVATFIANELLSVSIITKLELMGFHDLKQCDYEKLDNIFKELNVIPLTDTISSKIIELRQIRKIKLADAVIAATALALVKK